MSRSGARPPAAPHGFMAAPVKKEKAKDARKSLKRLISYIGKSKYLFFALMIIMVFVTGITLMAPVLQGKAIDTITVGEGVQIDFRRFAMYLAMLLAVYILSSFFAYLQGVFSAKLSQMTVKNLRADLFGKIVRLPIKYIDTHQHGDIMSRMTNDVENISNSISQSIGSLISAVFTIVGSLVIMIYYSPYLTLVSMLTVFLSFLATGLVSKHMRKYFFKQQSLLGRLNGHIEEMVTGYKTVVAFSKEKMAQQKFDEISTDLRKYGIKAQILGGLMGPMMNVVGGMGFLLIAGFGGYLAFKDVITVGTIQMFIIYSRYFTRPVAEIANQYAQIQTALAGAERVFDVMMEKAETDEGTVMPEIVLGDISFENVCFSYKEGEMVLENFNLRVSSGQKVAIVGATGSGKTTVVNLLTRFYDVDAGSITLGGVDIKKIKKKNLREAIAIVLQDTVLFSDTVFNNIRYGRLGESDVEVRKAAATANADRFIERLLEGYDTPLLDSGGNLSEGQRQLLSIARAVLKDPKILILDEATSSVDTRTEMHIQKAMLSLMKNRTSLIIAHRLSTIRDADVIVVIDKGSVAETGSHEELLEKKGCYYQLYQSQFAGVET